MTSHSVGKEFIAIPTTASVGSYRVSTDVITPISHLSTLINICILSKSTITNTLNGRVGRWVLTCAGDVVFSQLVAEMAGTEEGTDGVVTHLVT